MMMSRQSDEQFSHFQPALLEVLMACARSTFATCYSVERAGRSFSRISQLRKYDLGRTLSIGRGPGIFWRSPSGTEQKV